MDKEINKYVDSNAYIKNEIKLISLVEQMKSSRKNYNEFRHHHDNREYMHHFSEEEVIKIKELIKSD